MWKTEIYMWLRYMPKRNRFQFRKVCSIVHYMQQKMSKFHHLRVFPGHRHNDCMLHFLKDKYGKIYILNICDSHLKRCRVAQLVVRQASLANNNATGKHLFPKEMHDMKHHLNGHFLNFMQISNPVRTQTQGRLFCPSRLMSCVSLIHLLSQMISSYLIVFVPQIQKMQQFHLFLGFIAKHNLNKRTRRIVINYRADCIFSRH